MRIGVLGTGTVGRTLATALVRAGHQVALGARSAENPDAAAWAAEAGEGAAHGTFDDASADAEVLINATSGLVSAAAIGSIAADRLAGVVLLDLSNALDFSAGFPPRVAVPEGGTSVAERLQQLHPDTRVVKALNTVNVSVMVDPGALGSDHVLPIAGNDDGAKTVVRGLLRDLGWADEQVLDLGGLAGARGMEHYLTLWLSLTSVLGTPQFNVAIRR